MPSKKEIESVLQQDTKTRFEYAIKRIAGNEEVWVAEYNNEFLLMGDDEDNEVFPLWPHEEYVQVFCDNGRPDYKPTSITLDDFIELYIPDCEKKNQKIGVMPMPNGASVVVDVDIFMQAINAELDKYL
ncbi:DUF2750 domain-containing protein [Chitinophaga sancti]|uniref:DUF2750 domain-containing protein n=1 Tax=Chitinophaga sancti TaxID=1004 RepID=A0A1K1ST29_9BACT|nr:DUF2750 domain-containing protein [Chitinophaga sancti]WQD65402.1 DUF2750 domain-containing protein [Chitinophaga sancti]WQG88974.1 DUF2750 domain-containing protein [Chitinophaga sancti]SFW87388.1 Protein of unknown function [Chitinophaga sancti]